ncbi:hypothetical protein L9F63_017242 [Diploptera punctata]|uniref:DUF4781 domain-containing protein n=1 Tax=Diploptera punctata TaxID=6984 RepID=A0AAD7ZZB4_DIPPU|nr:hypothetical protein L9F63_017242 [Diploptera punctata]
MEVPNAIREKQELYWNQFHEHNWPEYKINRDEHILKGNIGFAFFGGPNNPDETNEDINYNEEEREFIDNMFKLIMKLEKDHLKENNLWVSFVCVSCKYGDHITEIPVIRVPNVHGTGSANEDMFIDRKFRVYKSWQDYLDNNKLSQCLMYYPRGGKYFNHGDHLILEMRYSPEAQRGTQVLNILDLVSGLQHFFNRDQLPSSSLGAAGICAAAMAAGCYKIYRNVSKLHDRRIHMQSIAPNNTESRNCYLGILGSGMCIVSSGIALNKTYCKHQSINAASQKESISNEKSGQNVFESKDTTERENSKFEHITEQKDSKIEDCANHISKSKDSTDGNDSKFKQITDQEDSKTKITDLDISKTKITDLEDSKTKSCTNQKDSKFEGEKVQNNTAVLEKVEIIINSIGKVNEIANILQNCRNSKQMTLLDKVQVTSHVLFFTHCVISTDLVDDLVKKAGENNTSILNVVNEMTQGAIKVTHMVKNLIIMYQLMSPAVNYIIGTMHL